MPVGVDGCRGGWVALAAGDAQARAFASFAALAEAYEGDVLAVDIPIGLLDAGRTGDRACDKAARAALGPRRASVFPPPTRAQLDDPRGLTEQTRLLLPKIREVDAWVAAHPGARVREAHPELAFALAAGAPLPQGKRAAGGRRDRRAVLAKLGIQAQAPAPEGELRVAEDDLMDAAILSWTAQRIARGVAKRFGDAEFAIWA